MNIGVCACNCRAGRMRERLQDFVRVITKGEQCHSLGGRQQRRGERLPVGQNGLRVVQDELRSRMSAPGPNRRVYPSLPGSTLRCVRRMASNGRAEGRPFRYLKYAIAARQHRLPCRRFERGTPGCAPTGRELIVG